MEEAAQSLSGAAPCADCGFSGWAISAPKLCHSTSGFQKCQQLPWGWRAFVIERKLQFFHCGVRLQQQSSVSRAGSSHLSALCSHIVLVPGFVSRGSSPVGPCGSPWMGLEQPGLVKVGGTAGALSAFPTQIRLCCCLAPTSAPHLWPYSLCQVLEQVLIQANTL